MSDKFSVHLNLEQRTTLQEFSNKAQTKLLEKLKKGYKVTNCHENKIEITKTNGYTFMIDKDGNMDQL